MPANNTANYITTSVLAQMPLQLASSPYLSGSAGTEPTYTQAQSLALVAGANTVGEDLFSASGTSVSINSGIVALSGQDFFAAPPASLQVTTASTYAVLYIGKKATGTSATSAQIVIMETPSATTAEEALTSAKQSIAGVYVPLLVLSSDASSNQTIEWSLDQNSQYSSPIFNQLGQIQQWQGTTKSFIETQLSALMSDLTGFASWEQSARNNQIKITFSLPSGQNLSQMNYTIPGGVYAQNGIMNPAGVIFSNYLSPFVMLSLSGIQNTTSSVSTGNYFEQIHNTDNGNDFWFAPSQDVSFPLALQTTNGGGWIKGVQWQTDGNIYFTSLSPNEQDTPLPCGIFLEDGVGLNRYNGSEQVATLPPNPLANPTFQTGW